MGLPTAVNAASAAVDRRNAWRAGGMSLHGDGECGCEVACLPDVEARGGFAADDTPAASLRTSLWWLPVR